MEKLHITKVTATDKKADGTQIINKFGKQSWRVGILTNEYGNTWLNGFLPFNPDKWANSVQELEVYEEEYQGKMQKKFKLPSKNDAIEKRLKKLEEAVFGNKQ